MPICLQGVRECYLLLHGNCVGSGATFLLQGCQNYKSRITTLNKKGKMPSVQLLHRHEPYNCISRKLKINDRMRGSLSRQAHPWPCTSPSCCTSSCVHLNSSPRGPVYHFHLPSVSISTSFYVYIFNSCCRSSLLELSNSSSKLPIIVFVNTLVAKLQKLP